MIDSRLLQGPTQAPFIMRRLLLPLLAALALPAAAKAESHWLVITFGGVFGGDGKTSQKIEMPSAKACETEGRRWENSPTHSAKSKFRRFHCVIGK